jgi:hypothetical protein
LRFIILMEESAKYPVRLAIWLIPLTLPVIVNGRN